jgi:hypothetical protein
MRHKACTLSSLVDLGMIAPASQADTAETHD